MKAVRHPSCSRPQTAAQGQAPDPHADPATHTAQTSAIWIFFLWTNERLVVSVAISASLCPVWLLANTILMITSTWTTKMGRVSPGAVLGTLQNLFHLILIMLLGGKTIGRRQS